MYNGLPQEVALLAHDYRDLIRIFDGLFRDTYQTVLIAGESEPIYLAQSPSRALHQIVFAHGFFSSALHEVAHWTLAGKARRALDDFGYWYKPDGRTEEEQRLFEQVEVRPQAMEWIYSLACGLRFVFSADNLSGQVGDMGPFKEKVRNQVGQWLERGLPNRRARQLVQALQAYYATPHLHLDQFQIG